MNLGDRRAAENARRAFYTCPFCHVYVGPRAETHLDRCRAKAKAELARVRYRAA